MITAKHPPSADSRSLRLERVFDAPRELVFRNWLEPELIAHWFAPDPFTVTACQVDARPGGKWRVDYRSNVGEAFTESGEFREIVAPERLVMTLTQQPASGDRGPETLVTVTFEATGTQTRMMFLQTGFDSEQLRDGNAEGWTECFAKLQRSLARATRS